jgi:hypothetical protein
MRVARIISLRDRVGNIDVQLDKDEAILFAEKDILLL